jgi:cell division septation protein DedD
MRNLFLVLVLANLAFAAWHRWYAPLGPVPHAPDPSSRRLTLVSEVPADLRSAGTISESELPTEPGPGENPAAEPAGSPPPAASSSADARPASSPVPVTPAAATSSPAAGAEAAGRCTSIGPFRDLSQAATAASTLRAAGFQPEQRVAEGEIWIGYWVYIQAIPTLADANEILSKVRDSGITDSYVIPNSDSGNLVSLGVFTEISGVSRRRDQVRALGYEPQVVDRTRRATVYWVDVTLRDGQVVDFDALQPPGRIMRLEQRPCATAPG